MIDLPVSAKRPQDTLIVVAMSGGVDSSVTAALLVEKGFNVVGITLQLYDHGAAVNKKGACCAGQDIYDARRVAERLGVPHYVLDYEARFRKAVIGDFVETYLRGETPIPCIRCNQRIKFEDLLSVAQDLGADALATGHYVRRIEGEAGPELHSAVDRNRDQSYFLFATTRHQLAFLRFPLGDIGKEETRAIAARFGLPVAAKPDSQDICFVPTGDYAALIDRLRPGTAEPGDIVDLSGRILGRHKGLIHFTIGQRKGLGIASDEPLYVVRLDVDSNLVVVGPRQALASSLVSIGDVNWLAPDHDNGTSQRVSVKLRSTQPPVMATVDLKGSLGEIILDEPVFAVAPGQACVIYDGTRVLGGGWIRRQTACPAFSGQSIN